MHRETLLPHPEIEEEYDEQPSKTRRKQEMHDLQALGEQLVGINNERLRQLTLTDNLLAAIIEAKRITTHGARRRQMQYIGKLMRTIDAAPIQDKLDEWNGASRAQNAKFHQLELWRERLLADDQVLNELARECPAADLQKIRTLIRNARRELAAGQPPKSSRALFGELRAALLEEEKAA
jgi:ribosome-associated protein